MPLKRCTNGFDRKAGRDLDPLRQGPRSQEFEEAFVAYDSAVAIRPCADGWSVFVSLEALLDLPSPLSEIASSTANASGKSSTTGGCRYVDSS
jgi:hypothetical protein